MANVFADSVRECDFVSRFGGEEFVVLVTETDLEGARSLAERLRAAVEALEVDVPSAGRAISITVSFGVSAISSQDESHLDPLKRADLALYEAKHAGRNTVRAKEADPLAPWRDADPTE